MGTRGKAEQEAHVPEGTGGTPPRTLAEALRTQSDSSLAALLRARPDLLTPVPSDLSQLATRAGTRASVVRALERLDRFTLQTAEALAVAPEPAPYDTLRALLTGDEGDPRIEEALPGAVRALRDRALIWGGDDRLRLVRTARELLAPSPAHPSPTGLGPTVAEATSGMSPGRLQEILAAAGLPSTHDPVSAVAALSGLFTDRTRMAALLDTAPMEALSVLDRLVWGPPYGEVTSTPTPPVQWLRDRGLLLPATTRTVVLPREAALHLRAGRAHRTPEPFAPAVAPRAPEAAGGAPAGTRPLVVDSAAAAQAYTALATVEELAKDWNEGGPNVLRAGGLSVRDLKRTASALGASETVAAFWVELAYTAGLLATDGEADERYAPTPAYDEWQELPPPERWARIATAWLASTRTPGLAGSQDSKGRTLAALGPDLDRGAAPEVRRRILELLATLPEGIAPDPESLLARLRWERPLRGASATGRADDLRSRLAAWTLNEAEMLGVTGRGALSTHGRALLGPKAGVASGDSGSGAPTTTASTPTAPSTAPPVTAALPITAPLSTTPPGTASLSTAGLRAAAALAPHLPEPLDHVLLQADLTAVAPGPLLRPLAELLSIAADVESKGGATVYRFTPGSVRRALDAGQSASDLHDFLKAHSRTPVPQPLAYLIDDVARKHGHLRVGSASAYVRCDDEAVLDEILADKRSQSLRLRRLAPTVLSAHADPAALLDGLRTMGFAPAAESAEGDVMITRAHAHRTPPRAAPAPVPDGPPVPDATLLGAAVRAIRAGDRAATVARKPAQAQVPVQVPPSVPAAHPEPSADGASPVALSPDGRLPRTTSAETLATVQAAAMTGSAVWIGYVNADGAASQRVIAPVRVEGGYVTAYDHTADEVRTYPLHRITGVAELADDPA
ncbi:helicase-associated domain-containing protein [Streptomyces sp. GMY02]|uniref:helicase C-terminal domain-containing protein n=1 Tax=Streptomyces sp. GMY02 TaxID=1333528 RepID=UPI001C2CA0DE|nr:helicase C-terminal domain-containing protein [Streptomyces sp. GMY02]QXE36280.1 helicase-associated domain-containing protein [Streptomyces sp. GMY02]